VSSSTSCVNEPKRWYGKFRGKVLDNLDPLDLHRILVDVPALEGLELSWALPCVPYAGMQVGFCMLPPLGANVWVEFEGGDPTHPIWTGCFWGEMEKPLLAVTPFTKVLKTDGLTLIIDDTPGEGGIKMIVGPPAVEVPVTILIDSAGIQIETAEALISISPEEMSATIPPTVATLTEASVSIETEGAVTITAESTDITGEVTMNGEVIVNGDTDFNGAVEVVGDVGIVGATEMAGDLDVTGGVEVVGDLAFVGAIELAGDMAVAGAIEVAGDVTAAVVEVAVP
jgi:cytoskeletal protein CcmA (bactofilin family)